MKQFDYRRACPTMTITHRARSVTLDSIARDVPIAVLRRVIDDAFALPMGGPGCLEITGREYDKFGDPIHEDDRAPAALVVTIAVRRA